MPDNLKPDLKIIKGELEKEIRTSYFGGNVDVFINEATIAYHHDMNSQYPKAMLKDMPIGNPVLSLENNLEKIFGFVYGEITAPDESVLRVPFIQFKDPLNKMNTCPRGKFKRLIFSEEIKYAINYGYKINVEYCYQFKRGKDLFKDYVNDHFDDKLKSIDAIQRTISKLNLNSLYGRLGIKDVDNTMKIVSKTEAEILDKNTNVSLISELDEYNYIVRYNGEITDNIRKLYLKDPIISENSKVYNKAEIKKSGLNKTRDIPSAVHIAAAISAYARTLINEYKNIPGNPCIMSDTDSAVLPKPLPGNLVGKGLGQMKLEHELKKGVFIRKKLYSIINSNNQVIVRSSGIDSSKLNWDSFNKLLKGDSVKTERTNFNVEWKTLSINVVESETVVQGLTGKIKTIYNTPDVNFRYISFPVSYNIIIHPRHSILTKVNINTAKKNKKEIEINGDKDIFFLFSKLEIIFFIVSLFLFSMFIIIYIFYFTIVLFVIKFN